MLIQFLRTLQLSFDMVFLALYICCDMAIVVVVVVVVYSSKDYTTSFGASQYEGNFTPKIHAAFSRYGISGWGQNKQLV